MGFKPVVDRIVKMTRAERQTLLFSATLEGEVGRIAKAYTSNPRRHEHAHPVAQKADVSHRFVMVSHEGKVAKLVAELGEPERGLTLVFVRTKRGADRLVKRLASSCVQAVAMHGDKSQGQRERALANFEAGVVDTLVATDVAARGIDVAGITPRDQLRHPRHTRGLRPPHRAHRPRGGQRHGRDARGPRSGPRTGRPGRRPGSRPRAPARRHERRTRSGRTFLAAATGSPGSQASPARERTIRLIGRGSRALEFHIARRRVPSRTRRRSFEVETSAVICAALSANVAQMSMSHPPDH